MKHWMSWTKFYICYRWIIDRCSNINNIRYKNYWWRWIKCEWKTFDEFKNDMYDSYQKHMLNNWWLDTTIERIDVNWNYCKENCKWVTMTEQYSNKVNTIFYKWTTLINYCKKNNINVSTIYSRIYMLWWSIEEAILWKEKYKNNKKQVQQIDFDWNIIKIWNSTMDIERELNIKNQNISNVCKWKAKTAWWYKWKYI